MDELFKSIKHPIIKRVLILSDNDTKFQADILYKNIYDILLSNYNRSDIFAFNHYTKHSNPSIQSIPNIFIMNLPYIRDERGRIICNTQIIINADVVIKIKNYELSILKHRIASTDLMHKYTEFNISFLSLVHKFLHIRKNIYT